MPTLHDVTDKTKQALRWFGIVAGAILLLVFLFQGGLFLKDYLFPTPPVPPTTLFGKLPKQTFPGSQEKKGYRIVIDTVSGKLPIFLDDKKKPLDKIRVYKIEHHELTLLDLQNTKNQAGSVGFRGPGIRISGNIYRFHQAGDLPKSLDIDIVEKNFTVTSLFQSNKRVLAASFLPEKNGAIAYASGFLSNLGVLPKDIDTKLTKAQFLSLQDGKLIEAKEPSDAQIIRVDFFQNPVDKLPIYYPQAIHSTMHFLVASGASGTPDIVLGNFFHQSIVTPSNATYPLKPLATAYQELVDGKGYVAADFTKSPDIKIKDVLLGYYATDAQQEYLMPIYIFKGLEDEFYAYVSAIDDTWIEGKATSPPVDVEQKN